MIFFLTTAAVSWSAILMLLAVSAATDLKDRLIPNELVVAVAAIGLTQGLLARPWQVWLSLLAAVVVFCGLGVLSHYRIIGGGDLKLISAVTFLVPPDRVGQLLIEIALAGGVLSCVYLAARYGLKSSAEASSTARREPGIALTLRTERARIAAGDPLPYAVAVLGGVLIYVMRDSLMLRNVLLAVGAVFVLAGVAMLFAWFGQPRKPPEASQHGSKPESRC